MTQTFHELLLSELRMVVYQPGDPSQLNDRLLCEAVTLNENLQSLGYVLKPDDLVKLAASPSLHGFYDHLRSLVPDITAQPMYPGFPQQVMNMSQAEFRMHQLMHYFSTYGMETVFGMQVSRGWLPAYRDPARTKEDTALLEARVLDLVAEADAPLLTLSTLLARRERLTNPELDLVVEAASLCTAEQMQELKVRFKENLDLLFPKLLEEADRKTALRTLRCICSHSGDVLRCTAAYLSRRRYHLRTSEKKLLVKLLESYSQWNFRQNLMQSNSLRERNLMILQHLDYNQYSRSPEHKEAVRALRNSELLSWHGIGEELLKKHSPKALAHFAQRPGYMLRMLNRLLSLGYSKDAILEVLTSKSGSISGHLILQALRSLADRGENLEETRQTELNACRQKYAQMFWQYEQWRIEDANFWEKQNCIDQYQHAFQQLLPEYSCHTELQACLAKAAQDRAAAQRCSKLHKSQALNAMKEHLHSLEDQLFRESIALEKLKDTSVFHRWPYLRSVCHYNMVQSGHTGDVDDAALVPYLPFRYQKREKALQEEIVRQELRLAQMQAQNEAWLAGEQKRIQQEAAAEYEESIRQINLREQAELARLEQKFQKTLAEARKQQKNLPLLEKKEMADIEAKYQRIRRTLSSNDAAVEILRELLCSHFRQVVTPLKGKKVFCDFKQFDLKHSALETSKRSKDGGYIRSGISWKIPDNAKYVRFFIYWNDRNRVDIDLHAGGTMLNGDHIHVGWNADFCDSGVLHSGDITHSDAAEYIDIDLSAPIREISTNVHLFDGKCGFPEVETCYVGMMAVDQIGQCVQHYSPKNCFFTHKLTQNVTSLFYGFVDVQNRCVRFVGQPNESSWDSLPRIEDTFSLQDYLDCVTEGQQVQLVETAEEADVVLTMGKSILKNGISLVDNNFFLEC